MTNQNNMNNIQNMNEQPPMQPMTPMTPTTPMAPVMPEEMENQPTYPEVYYKLQPYIMIVCDQMDVYGPLMPTREMVERITDNIYDDVCRMYPEMAEYARTCDDKGEMPTAAGWGDGFQETQLPFFRRFRRIGLFRDIIDILLLLEFGRRRRRFDF